MVSGPPLWAGPLHYVVRRRFEMEGHRLAGGRGRMNPSLSIEESETLPCSAGTSGGVPGARASAVRNPATSTCSATMAAHIICSTTSADYVGSHGGGARAGSRVDRKSTRLNSSH